VCTGLCFITPSFAYFCVGEVTRTTTEEIGGLFRQVCLKSGWSMFSGGTEGMSGILARTRETNRVW
jgi:hypothetical protein